MLRQVWEFIVAVVHRWGVLTTGGVVVALIGFAEHLGGRPITGWPLWIAVATSLVSAFFSAWRQERLKVEALNARIVPQQRRKDVRDHLSRLLKAKDKFVRVLNDPHQIVAAGNIDQWEMETCIYLRENLSEADENLFMDTTGVPQPPEYMWNEERVEQLERLHYCSYQLRKILDGLSGAS
jgi:hypothetical protein